MLAYCGRPPSASFRDPFAYIGAGYARETIAEICSMGDALATAIISRTGSWAAGLAWACHIAAQVPPGLAS
jgi:hypothetical protein